MKFTDNEAIRLLNKANCCELSDMISDYPEADRDGRTDLEMLANEAGWLLDSFNSNETAHNDDLREARARLSKLYRVQKRRGLSVHDMIEYDNCRWIINEYNRLTSLVKKLKAMGLYCPYC